MSYTNWVDLIHLLILSVGIRYLYLINFHAVHILRKVNLLYVEYAREVNHYGLEEMIMPLNEKGKKIKKATEKTYGKKKGDSVFYAMENSGKIKGVKKHG